MVYRNYSSLVFTLYLLDPSSTEDLANPLILYNTVFKCYSIFKDNVGNVRMWGYFLIKIVYSTFV